MALWLSASTATVALPDAAFESCQPAAPNLTPGNASSVYVEMRDGIRIAVDVLLPDARSGKQYPTVLEMTRYWRSAEGDPSTAQAKNFSSHGFAVVTGDVRGTGASFGTWPYHRSRAETLDFGDLITWIAHQPWSDGQVFGYGVSYSANTADWMPERGNPALKGIVPRFPDFDPYADLYFPGGIANRWMIETWGSAVKQMDLNLRQDPHGKSLPGVKPVDADRGKVLLGQAIDERRPVPSVAEGLAHIMFRDDRPPSWHGASMNDWGIYSVKAAVERAQTPIQSWASWFDAGTAQGVLHRFVSQTNPQRVFIGAWAHGGYKGASPFAPRGAPPNPPSAEQNDTDLCFLDRLTRATAAVALQPRKLLFYYTLGAERWNRTATWPPPEAKSQRWYFGDQHRLALREARGSSAADRYHVDYAATTGTTNRWHTNGGVPEVFYGNRSSQDAKLLTYTSAPLRETTEITGQPEVHVFLQSDRSDLALFVYLEDIDRHGEVRYLTEGELRGIDRRVSTSSPPYRIIGPYHSFRREDSAPLEPGKTIELALTLMPISVSLPAGHRIRVALAGADADTFQRIPETGDNNLLVQHDRGHPSGIVLPIVSQP